LIEAAKSDEPVFNLPAKPHNASTACDMIHNSIYRSPPNREEVVVCGTASTNVTMNHIVITANSHPGCDRNILAVFVAGGSSLRLVNSKVTAAAPIIPDNCSLGGDIAVGMSGIKPIDVGHAQLQADTISGYATGGIGANGPGTTLIANAIKVVGLGPSSREPQAGIAVTDDALAQISHSVITNNICGPLTDTSCAPRVGISFEGAQHGSFLEYSTISDNNYGASYNCLWGVGCNHAWLKHHVDVTFLGDHFVSNNQYDLSIIQGRAATSSDILSGGQVGYVLWAQCGDNYATDFSASSDHVSGMSVAAVQVLGNASSKCGGLPGTVTLTNSKLSGNPGATVAASILNSCPIETVRLSNDD
jgi:hypothetical protein